MYYSDSPLRKSFIRKRINYNLVNGILDLNDMSLILNPDNVDASYIPENIQHYPVMKSKLNLLAGEERKRRFDWYLIITNPNAVSEIEENKKNELFGSLQSAIQADHQGYGNLLMLEWISYHTTLNYEWQDAREERGNLILNHYIKEPVTRDKLMMGLWML